MGEGRLGLGPVWLPEKESVQFFTFLGLLGPAYEAALGWECYIYSDRDPDGLMKNLSTTGTSHLRQHVCGEATSLERKS